MTMKPFLFNESLLPEGFEFPNRYIEFAQNNSWPDLDPWSFLALDKPTSLLYFGRMSLKFPEATLIPFAWINDQSGFYNDGWVVLACFDASELKEPHVRIYDCQHPKSTPWDNFSYKNFDEWIVAAKKESDKFKSEKLEEDD